MERQFNQTFDDTPALDGPDYVALVIEWDQLADSIEDELAFEDFEDFEKTVPLMRRVRWGRLLGLAAGALGLAALAGWGVHRLRA